MQAEKGKECPVNLKNALRHWTLKEMQRNFHPCSDKVAILLR